MKKNEKVDENTGGTTPFCENNVSSGREREKRKDFWVSLSSST